MGHWADDFRKKLIEPKSLKETAELIKKRGKRIATLNGSFDLLHAGHLHIIYSASQAADVLIVALNSDCSIQQYKSKDRPIIPLKYRLQMMAALQFVDYVTYFGETSPIDILLKIKPDVHVNGAEYGKNCIEAKAIESYGGKIQIIDLLEGFSTTNIMNKIAGLKSDAPFAHIQ